MGTDREDAYDECKSYVQNIDLCYLLDDMIFDADYNDMDKNELIKLKMEIIKRIRFFEKRKYNGVLYDPQNLEKSHIRKY